MCVRTKRTICPYRYLGINEFTWKSAFTHSRAACTTPCCTALLVHSGVGGHHFQNTPFRRTPLAGSQTQTQQRRGTGRGKGRGRRGGARGGVANHVEEQLQRMLGGPPATSRRTSAWSSNLAVDLRHGDSALLGDLVDIHHTQVGDGPGLLILSLFRALLSSSLTEPKSSVSKRAHNGLGGEVFSGSWSRSLRNPRPKAANGQ